MQLSYNKNIETIKFLHNIYFIDHTNITDNKHNFLTVNDYETKKKNLFIKAVYHNDFDYLNKMHKYIDVETIKTCFIIAVTHNKNIEIISLLHNTFDIDHNSIKNNDNENLLFIACSNNASIHIVRYLVENLKIDTTFKNKRGRNCLLEACDHSCDNFEIIKYFVEKLHMNFDDMANDTIIIQILHLYGHLDIIKYLIEKNIGGGGLIFNF